MVLESCPESATHSSYQEFLGSWIMELFDMPRPRILGVANHNKRFFIDQIEEHVSALGYPPSHDNEDLLALRNKLCICQPKGSTGTNAVHCWEIFICPRCNRNHQDRVAKENRERTEALIKAGCIPLRFRGSVAADACLLDNLKKLDDTLDKFVEPWMAGGRKRLKSIWAHVIAGLRTGIHVAKNMEPGRGWYCHVHAVIWINPSKPAAVQLAMKLLHRHWLDCVGPGTPHIFADVRTCYSKRTTDARKLWKAESAGDYLIKVWEFADLKSILEARVVTKLTTAKMTRSIGLCHQRSKLPKQLAFVPLTRKQVDAYFADKNSKPDHRYTRLPGVCLNAPTPPIHIERKVEALKGWSSFSAHFITERRFREVELAHDAREEKKQKSKQRTTVNDGWKKRRVRPEQKDRHANTDTRPMHTLREGADDGCPVPHYRTGTPNHDPVLQDFDRRRNRQALDPRRRDPGLPERRPHIRPGRIVPGLDR